jgi:membrane protease YdiL (CAAX protease family)
MQLKGYLAAPMETGTWWRGAEGVRAGWRIAIWVLLITGIALLEYGVVRLFIVLFHLPIPHPKGLTPLVVCLGEGASLIPVFGASWMMGFAEGTGLTAIGLGREGGALALNGGALGLLSLNVLVLILVLAGAAGIQPGGMGALGDLRYGAEWLLASLLIGLFEEMLLRGYLLQALWRGLGFWPAAVLTSLIFGALHGHNPGETYTGLVAVTCFGIFISLSIRYTGSLWWGITFHGLWDYGENFVFGSADSGNMTLHTFLRMAPKGNVYLSGGATGPEGSVLCLAMIFAGILLLWKVSGARPGAQNLSPSTAT